MVEDDVPKPESSNSCCKVVRLSFFLPFFSSAFCALLIVFHFISLWFFWEQWKDMYMKLEEKRVALRQGVKLLDEQIKRIQAENLNLKKGRISIMMIFLCLFLYVVRTIFLLAGWVWVLQKECLFI